MKEDGDGAGVSRNEFGMVLNAEGLPEVAIMALFGQVDVNKSGTITKDEITSVFPTEAVVNLDEELKDGGQSPVEWVGFWRKLFDSKDKHNVGLYLEKCLDLVRHLKPAFSTETGIPYNIVNLKKVSLFLFAHWQLD